MPKNNEEVTRSTMDDSQVDDIEDLEGQLTKMGRDKIYRKGNCQRS